MNREIDQSGLAKIVAEKIGMDSGKVDAFVSTLFANIEKQMTGHSLVRLDNLGILRVIRGGGKNRILFLTAAKKESVKQQQEAGPSEKTTNDREVSAKRRIETVPPIAPIKKEPAKPVTAERSRKAEEEIITDTIPVVNAPQPAEYMPAEDTRADIPGIEYRMPEVNRRVIIPAKSPSQVFGVSNILRNINLPKPLRKYKGSLKVSGGLAFAILLLAMFVKPGSEKPHKPGNRDIRQALSEYQLNELENTDKQYLNSVIIAERNISLKELSTIYYGDEKFWPYLYKANENIVSDDYIIRSKSIIRIPRITVDLADLNTGKLDDKLDALAANVGM